MTDEPTANLSDDSDKVLRDLFGDDPQPPPGWTPPTITPDLLTDWNHSHCHVPDFVFTRAGMSEYWVREQYPDIVIIKPHDPRVEA